MAALSSFADRVAEVRGLALALAKDESPDARAAAARTLIALPNDPAARAELAGLLKDSDARVRQVPIEAIGILISIQPQAENATVSLRALVSEEMTNEALQLLDRLENALNTLQDLGGLDEAQIKILDEIVLPTIAQLRALFAAEAANTQEVQGLRKDGVLRIGALSGATKALLAAAPAAITAIAQGDEVAENIKNSIEGLHPFAEALFSLVPRGL